MKRIVNYLIVGIVSALPFGGAEASETIEQVIKNSPSKIVCEIVAREGSNKSYAIFHLMGFDDAGNLRYRGITANLMEIRMTSDGKLLSDRTPCLSDPVAFQ